MSRLVALVLALSLVLAACGGGTAEPESTTAGETTSASPTTSPDPTVPETTRPSGDGGSDATTTTAAPSTTTTSDRPPAPDFTLALGDGGTFTLSAERKPVYMVFWAEW